MRGVIGFPLTPFQTDLSLDLKRLEEGVNELASRPFCAINAPAGISEVFSLDVDEAVAVAECTVRVTAGRMPVIGCVATNWALGREMARRMEQAGADALLVLPPSYSNAPFDGLLKYYRDLGRATALPLAIYSRGWAAFRPEQVERLAEEIPTLKYWKDGQADPRAFRRIMNRVGGRLTWIGGSGDDCAAAYAAIGIEVFTSSVSAVAPEIALAWGAAALERDYARLNRLLDELVHPLFAIRTRKRGYEVAAMKKVSELWGRPVGVARPPLPELGEEDIADLRKVVTRWREFVDTRELDG